MCHTAANMLFSGPEMWNTTIIIIGMEVIYHSNFKSTGKNMIKSLSKSQNNVYFEIAASVSH